MSMSKNEMLKCSIAIWIAFSIDGILNTEMSAISQWSYQSKNRIMPIASACQVNSNIQFLFIELHRISRESFDVYFKSQTL